MGEEDRNVKATLGRWARAVRWCAESKLRMLNFIDGHARVGWFIAMLSVLNVVLNLLDLAK